jgi:hypothetical protein
VTLVTAAALEIMRALPLMVTLVTAAAMDLMRAILL